MTTGQVEIGCAGANECRPRSGLVGIAWCVELHQKGEKMVRYIATTARHPCNRGGEDGLVGDDVLNGVGGGQVSSRAICWTN
jgi:hypothetical protein